MRWNIAAECVSTIFLCIIWVYSRRGNPVPSIKNMLFQFCFLTTFIAMVTNILSTFMLAFPEHAPFYLTWIITQVYFAATPLMGMVYCYYTLATLYEGHPGGLRFALWTSLPGVLYLVIAVLNPFKKWLFDINLDKVYSQGPLVSLTYLVFYIYMVVVVVVVLWRYKWVEPSIRRILALFPIVAGVVVVFQQFYPTVVLSGSAATSALLLVYLFLQNKQISIDYLTGIPNRQTFLKTLEISLRSDASAEFTVLVLSLRNFKQFNDLYGQHSGDGFLRAVSTYLQTAFTQRMLYRYSGDEFAIVIKSAQREVVNPVIDAITERMKKPWYLKECTSLLQYGIGIVQYPKSADNVAGIINGIESAVSRAKEQDNGSVCYCDQKMLEEIRRRMQIVDILKDCLRSDGFEVYFQPIYSIHEKRFVFAESLLRIPNSPIGPIYPSEFIPIAEESGLIIEITYWVLEQVCAYINRLKREGVRLEGIHVNFSSLQFSQPDLKERVIGIITNTGVDRSKVRIEITESVLAESNQIVLDFVEEMKNQGIYIELDDFGTGYSNIISVMSTPLDVIKIDRSLIWSAEKNPHSLTMLRNVVRSFLETQQNVLAEGVETEAQLELARSCGIDLIQGFYFAKPMPGNDCLEFLQEQQIKSR